MLTMISLLWLTTSIHPAAFCEPADADAPPRLVWLASASEPDDDASADDGDGKKKFVIKKLGPGPGNIQPGGPWLGIQFGPVSSSLAAQLNLPAKSGQVVLNVIQGSPADTAGFQQHDVIVQVDGRDAPADIDEFMEIVRQFKVGEAHTFTLRRAGQTLTVSLTVGARPDKPGQPKYPFGDEFPEFSHDRVLRRGGILQKDPKGGWSFKGFNFKDLPDFWKAIPDVPDMDFEFAIPGLPGTGEKQVYIQKSKGQTLRVETTGDGKISVSRTETVNGEETTTTKTYDSVEALEKEDAEAAKLLKGGPQGKVGFLFRKKGPGERFEGHFNFDWDAHRKSIEEAMKAAEEAARAAQEQVNAAAARLPSGRGRATTTFERTADGKIKVVTRQGDAELITTYDSAEALKAADADLYEKYERLHAAQNDADE